MTSRTNAVAQSVTRLAIVQPLKQICVQMTEANISRFAWFVASAVVYTTSEQRKPLFVVGSKHTRDVYDDLCELVRRFQKFQHAERSRPWGAFVLRS